MMFIKPEWPASSCIHTFTTTRQGGVSLPPYNSLNLGLNVQDNNDLVLENQRRVKTHFQFSTEPLWLKQINGNNVVHANDYFPGIQADACYTDHPEQICVILTADCLPILVCHQNGNEIAAIHAGWRGLALGIIQQTFSKLKFSANQYLVWIAPGISAANYIVRQDVLNAFDASQDLDVKNCFIPIAPNQWQADLVALAQLILQRLGVKKIYGGNHCTYKDSNLFFSVRRDGRQTGRMASFIWMTKR